MDKDVIKEYLFFSESQGFQFRVALPPRLSFTSGKIGDLPDKHSLAIAVYEVQGRLDSGLFVYKFSGVEVQNA